MANICCDCGAFVAVEPEIYCPFCLANSGWSYRPPTGASVETPPPEHITQFFAFGHLPPHLQEVSKPFSELADFILTLPRNPERTVALRKLLEAKDAAVRAKLAK